MLSLFGNTVTQLIRESVNQSISYSKTYYKSKSIVLEFLQISTHQQQSTTKHLTQRRPRNIYNKTPPATRRVSEMVLPENPSDIEPREHRDQNYPYK